MAKIGHDAWAIAYAKWSVWINNEKCQKDATTVRPHWSCCVEKTLQKTPNNRKIRAFGNHVAKIGYEAWAIAIAHAKRSL